MPTSIIRPPNQSPQAVALFNALYELYLDAGKPSLRTIARDCGKGVISYNTVHKVLSGPGLPKYGHLEVIVAQLSGDNEDTIKHFKKLWTEAQRVEDRYHEGAANPNNNADMSPDETEGLRLRLADLLRERDQLAAERDRLAAAVTNGKTSNRKWWSTALDTFGDRLN